MQVKSPPLHCPCGGTRFAKVFTYTAPPEGEVRFAFSSGASYFREIYRCRVCSHFVSAHAMNTDGLYSGEYVTSTYGDDGIGPAFERIVSLDPSKSDNVGRVRRIVEFARSHLLPAPAIRTIVDVGSGLCVFLHAMKAEGWSCTAVDPDPRAARHAVERVGVRAVCGDFLALGDLGRFDVVTFNKVLEHVEDPVTMLAKARRHLNPGGFVYVEVPDAEAAVHDGPNREEFAIDHWHIFSPQSLAALAERSGFWVTALERLREPSTKYTLRAFLVPGRGSAGDREV